MSVMEFIFRKASTLLRIDSFFKRDISCASTASYFHYYVMPQCFSLDIRVFNLYLFRWQHWKITSERLFNNIFSESFAISNFLSKHKLHRLELGLYNLQFLLMLQDVCWRSFVFATFQYSVDNLVSFFSFFVLKDFYDLINIS